MLLEFVEIERAQDENGYTGEYQYPSDTNQRDITVTNVEFKERVVKMGPGQEATLAGTFTSTESIDKGRHFKIADSIYRIAMRDKTPAGLFKYSFTEVDRDI